MEAEKVNKNMAIWDLVRRPPGTALRQIPKGRLKGKSDISPQWRYEILTEIFGACGFGWKYEIVKTWQEPAADNQVFAFARVDLYVQHEGEWSDPIPGVGGSMLIANESRGPHSSDEAYKMAITDALSVAMKMLGVAADIYAGKWDGSKYSEDLGERNSYKSITAEQKSFIAAVLKEKGLDPQQIKDFALSHEAHKMTEAEAAIFLADIKSGKIEVAPPQSEDDIRKAKTKEMIDALIKAEMPKEEAAQYVIDHKFAEKSIDEIEAAILEMTESVG